MKDNQIVSAYKGRQTAGYVALTFLSLVIGSALAALFYASAGSFQTADFAGMWPVAKFTVWQALLSTLLSIAFALPVARAFVTFHRFPGRRFLLILFTLPLSLPVIVAVLGIVTLMGRNGIISQIFQWFGHDLRPDIYGLSGILIAHVFFNMPLAVRLLLERFNAVPNEHWKLAETLRFSHFERMRYILFPAIVDVLPGITSLIFFLCIGSYTIILVLGGNPGNTTLQVAIYQSLSFDFDMGRAAILTLAQLVILMVIARIAHGNRTEMIRRAYGIDTSRLYHQPGRNETILGFIWLTFATLFVAGPLGAMAYSGMMADHVRLFSQADFWRALVTSSTIGIFSALLAVGLTLTILSAHYSFVRDRKNGVAAIFNSVSAIALGIPSLILGVGWFILLSKSGVGFSPIPLLIILANMIMALPFATQILKPAVMKNFDAYDKLSASLGLFGWNRFWIVDVPVMRRAIMSALLFAFALSLGDLGVVTLFGSDQILTLPALLFAKMGSYRTDDAAGLALYLALFTGIISYLSLRAAEND